MDTERVQIAVTGSSAKLLSREIATAMQETGIQAATIVSLDTEEQIETDAGVIDVVPGWPWALQ